MTQEMESGVVGSGKGQNHVPVLNRGFGFKTIWILESLPCGELKTGRELSEDVLYYKQLLDPSFHVEFRELENKCGLYSTLQEIKKDLCRTHRVPLIHFEMHGNSEGLGLKSGELVWFRDLFPHLRDINVLSRHNLFVVVAACEGARLLRIVHLCERSPFWGILGPSEIINAQELLTGYGAFYENALSTGDMNSALGQLKLAIPGKGHCFSILSSELLFMLGIRRYFDEHCSPEAVEQRVQEALIKAQSLQGIDPVQGAIAAAKHRAYLLSEPEQRRTYEERMTKFFMHDLYPGEPGLPCPSFEDAVSFAEQLRKMKG